MKKILFTLLIAVTSVISGKADSNNSNISKIEANPINIAYTLSQKSDTAKIASLLDYYGYTPQTLPSEGWRASFTHPNGSQIRYKLTEGNKYPTVEVQSKASAKENDQILKDLNFKKRGNAYQLIRTGVSTHCSQAPHNSLIFTTETAK